MVRGRPILVALPTLSRQRFAFDDDGPTGQGGHAPPRGDIPLPSAKPASHRAMGCGAVDPSPLGRERCRRDILEVVGRCRCWEERSVSRRLSSIEQGLEGSAGVACQRKPESQSQSKREVQLPDPYGHVGDK